MKARVWKDRETGVWCFTVRDGDSGPLVFAGERRTWEQALLEVLTANDRRAVRA